MSIFSSLLAKRPRVGNFELPRWAGEPASMPAFPPPPVTNSVYYSTSSETPATEPRMPAVQSDEMLVVQRREKQLEQRIQALLDAQSDGLMALRESPSDRTPSATSESPSRTSSSRRDSSSRPPSSHPSSPNYPSHPRRPTLDLRSARRGIHSALLEYAAVKSSESSLLDDELSRTLAIHERLTRWDEKQTALHTTLTQLQSPSHPHSPALAELHASAASLTAQISAAEQHLAQLRAEQAQLRRRIAAAENDAQSLRSTYAHSRRLLADDVARFLAHPPHPLPPFAALPPSRRTLPMALTHYRDRVEALKAQRGAAREEQEALLEGAKSWKACVGEIVAFERYLAGAMAGWRPRGRGGSGIGRGTGGKRREGSVSRSPRRPDVRELLLRLDKLLSSVGEKLEEAERNGWTLMKVCIGAEMAALEEGRGVLEKSLGVEAVGPSRPGSVDGLFVDGAGDRGKYVDSPRARWRGEEAVLKSDDEEISRTQILTREVREGRVAPRDQVDDEDDGPGEDLLVEKGRDTDTDSVE